eukprot:COSAG01_NODE_4062_length_5387_cov_6.700076_1_plen_1267_part_00
MLQLILTSPRPCSMMAEPEPEPADGDEEGVPPAAAQVPAAGAGAAAGVQPPELREDEISVYITDDVGTRSIGVHFLWPVVESVEEGSVVAKQGVIDGMTLVCIISPQFADDAHPEGRREVEDGSTAKEGHSMFEEAGRPLYLVFRKRQIVDEASLGRSLSSRIQEKDWSNVLKLIPDATSVSPGYCATPGTYGMLPLQLAIFRKAPYFVFERLLAADPNPCTQRDTQGFLPLHLAIVKYTALDIVQLLLHKYPRAVTVTPEQIEDEDQPKYAADACMMALHLAIKYHAELEVITELLRRELLIAKKERHLKLSIETPDAHGRLPLHLALALQLEEQTILYLVEQYPQACEEKVDANGMLPLHLAITNLPAEGSMKVVQLLVEKFPDACSKKDGKDQLPLHYASQHYVPHQVLQLLVATHKGACSERDSVGLLPLHNLMMKRPSVRAVRTVIDAAPHTCLQRSGGQAMRNSFVRKSRSGRESLNGSGSSGALQVFAGRNSLDIAVEYKADLAVVKYLVQSIVQYKGSEDGLDTQDDTCRSLREIILGRCKDPDIRMWAKCERSFLGRYTVQRGPPVHTSRTARVDYATDERVNDDRNNHRRSSVETPRSTSTSLESPGRPSANVCLKLMKERSKFEIEIARRCQLSRQLSSGSVVGIRAWHMPRGETYTNMYGQSQELEHTDPTDPTFGQRHRDYPYVLVLERGERSLHDTCAKERLAGYDIERVTTVFRNILECVVKLHDSDIVHTDLKQRNVVRLNGSAEDGSDEKWIVCDMDESKELLSGAVNAETLYSTSRDAISAYAPPELAQYKASPAGKSHLINSELAKKFDVWSLGVILFELCSGRSLFAQDTSNDELVEFDDKVRLCAWETISDEELMPVGTLLHQSYMDQASIDSRVHDAKHLIRRCLNGNAAERPNVSDMLKHRFVCPTADPPPPCPMRYHAFLSHAQKDSSGIAATLYHEYKKLGLHTWLDVRQQDLTLAGMLSGVKHSDVFVIILSKHYLESDYCRKEMHEALRLKKTVQLVVEEDKRFSPFDRAQWKAQKQQDKVSLTKSGEETRLPADLCSLVDEHLSNAVIYRRRDFELAAMMHELCLRNKIVLPSNASAATQGSRPVAVIFHEDTAREVLDTIELHLGDAFTWMHDRDITQWDTRTVVLLLLTPGVLDKCEPLLRDSIEKPRHMVAMYVPMDTVGHTDLGWKFGCDEQQRASVQVHNRLEQLEALPYRQPDPDGPRRHEFPAMLSELRRRLLQPQPAREPEPETEPEPES